MKIHHPTTKIGRRSGFTLLEMVIVLGIIAMILGGVGYKMLGIQDAAKLKRVDGDFTSFQSALSMYKINAGSFPTTQQGLVALVKKPSTTPIPRRWAPVMSKVQNDPWERPYTYKFPGSKRANDYEIISSGPDGLANTDDDISSQDD